MPSPVSTPTTRPSLADDAGQLGEVVDLHAPRAQPLLDEARLGLREDVAPVAVLAHEVVDVHSTGAQALGDLEGGDAAADDHGRLGVAAPADQIAGVVQVVELDHAVELDAGHLGRDRPGARGEQQAIVGKLSAALQDHPVSAAVDARPRGRASSWTLRRAKSWGEKGKSRSSGISLAR